METTQPPWVTFSSVWLLTNKISALILLFSRLNSLSSLRLSSHYWCSNPLIIFFVPVLDLFQYVHAFLGLERPELDSPLKMCHRDWAKGKDHLTRLSGNGNAPPNAVQDSTGLLCHQGVSLSGVLLAVHQNPQDSSVQNHFLANWSSVCTSAWGYFSSESGLHISPCRASWDASWLNFSAWWGVSEWQHTHLVYQPLLMVFYHLLTCWGCTLS